MDVVLVGPKDTVLRRGIALDGQLTTVKQAWDWVDPLCRDFIKLDPRAVSSDMVITQDVDAVRRFSFRLLRKPWPRAGDNVAFRTDSTWFSGYVTHTELRSVNVERWEMTVQGNVFDFYAKALLD